jgi:hypothetical protein
MLEHMRPTATFCIRSAAVDDSVSDRKLICDRDRDPLVMSSIGTLTCSARNLNSILLAMVLLKTPDQRRLNE